MTFKTAIAAATLALFAAGAGAATVPGATPAAGTTNVTWVSGSFNDAVLGTFTFLGASNFSGNVGYLSTFTGIFGGQTQQFDLPSVNFTKVSLYSNGTEKASTVTNSFNFANLAAGSYLLKVSGNVQGVGFGGAPAVGGALAQYQVTAVPEPETYAMLLAGLGVMGAIARRRSKTAA